METEVGKETAVIQGQAVHVRRSYAKNLPKRFPEEYPEEYDPEQLSDDEIKKLAYNVYLRKYLRCVKGVDDNLSRLFEYLEEAS